MLAERHMTRSQLYDLRFYPDGYKENPDYHPEYEGKARCYTLKATDIYSFVDEKLLTITHTFWESKKQPEDFPLDEILDILGPPDLVFNGSSHMPNNYYLFLDKGIRVTQRFDYDCYFSIEVFPPMDIMEYVKMHQGNSYGDALEAAVERGGK